MSAPKKILTRDQFLTFRLTTAERALLEKQAALASRGKGIVLGVRAYVRVVLGMRP